MKKSEVLKLLTIASAFDSRRPTDEQIDAWYSVIGDLDYHDAEAAVREHYRRSTEWLMPAHIVEGVAWIMNERAWEIPKLSREDAELCAAAGVSPEEFVERRDEPGWVEHLRARWLGIES